MKTISKYLQLAVLLAFFLPFFPKCCEGKKTEEAPKTDTTRVKVDTSRVESSVANTAMNHFSPSFANEGKCV